MKKTVSVLLVLCMILAMTATLASCGHKCEFSTEWSKDATSHWHACTGKDCEEIADKADHTWDDGEITTKATQEADGVKTFTCEVCAQTKTESVAFTGMTEDEWNAALVDSVFENFCYTEVASTNGSGVSVDTETIYKFTKDIAWAKMTMAGESQDSFAPDKASADMVREQLVDSLKELASYDNFAYDAATKTYKATKDVEITGIGVSTDDVTITFADGKIVKVEYSVAFEQEGIDFTATSAITISDYGTVVLTPPAN